MEPLQSKFYTILCIHGWTQWEGVGGWTNQNSCSSPYSHCELVISTCVMTSFEMEPLQSKFKTILCIHGWTQRERGRGLAQTTFLFQSIQSLWAGHRVHASWQALRWNLYKVSFTQSWLYMIGPRERGRGWGWISQHSCSSPYSHCELVIQYMCHDKLRDWTSSK